MDCATAFLDLVAFCQREGVLSSSSDVVQELSEILGVSPDDAEALLDF